MPLKLINLMGPNPAQPFDIQTEQARLALAQQLANQLLTQGMLTSGPASFDTSPGNPFSRTVPNIADPIIRAVERRQGREQLNETADKQAALAQLINARNAQDTQNYMGLRFGGQDIPGTDVGPVQEGQAPLEPQKAKGNILAAISYGLMSQNPEMKKRAEEDLKGLPNAKEALQYGSHYSPEGLQKFLTNPQDATALVGRPTVQVHDNAIIPIQDGKVAGPITPAQTFKVGEAAPGVPASISQLTGEAKGVSGGTTSPQETFEKVLNADVVAQLKEGRKQWVDDTGKLQTLAQIRTDLASIPDEKFGTLADFRNSFNKLAELAGQPQDKTTSDVEVIKSNLGKLLLKDIRALAPVTKEDIAVVQGIVGTEGMTKRGLSRVMDILEAATSREMAQHSKMVDSIPLPPAYSREQIRSIYAPDVKFTTMPPTQAPAGQTDELRKKYGL